MALTDFIHHSCNLMFSTENLAKQKHVFAEIGHLQLLCLRYLVVIFHFFLCFLFVFIQLNYPIKAKVVIKKNRRTV